MIGTNNLNEELIIAGNARGHFFESPYLPLRIPISRSKSDEVIALFETQNS